MKVTLQVKGQEMTFSEKKLTSILEEYFKIKDVMKKPKEIAPVPTEGKWFRVNPLAIDQELFKEKKSDLEQERVRKLILDAFKRLKKNPKYSKPFKTLIPELEDVTDPKNVWELKEMAKDLGDHNANWIEWALMLSQQIANGETWEDICNKPDIASGYRLVTCRFQGESAMRVGGSKKNNDSKPASYSCIFPINGYGIGETYCTWFTVPLVVAYDD